MNNNKQEIKVDKKDFEFVQRDDRIFDQEFETKPVGYFQDVMSRFVKNKTNLVATFILILLVFLSIAVPTFTKKNHTQLEPRLSFLPARVPLLEKIGIFDGTTTRKQVDVDKSTIDPETGIGLPRNIDPIYIVPGSVTNYYVTGTDRLPEYEGGFNDMILATSEDHFAIVSNKGVFYSINDTTLKLEIEGINGPTDTKFNVYVEETNNNFVLVGTYTEAGSHEVKLSDFISNFPFTGARIKLEVTSEAGERANVSIKSVELVDTTKEETILYEGYSLSQFTRISGRGDFIRRDARRLVADFKYLAYDAAFSEWEITLSEPEYLAILNETPGMEDTITADPDNPEGWLFGEGFKIIRVLGTSTVVAGGIEYTNYRVGVDYGLYTGYESIPYFYFGTDSAGRDMFAMVFKALGTSLIIGLIVSFINITFGVFYGSISGYYGGKVDLIMERFTEVIGRIPWLVTLSIFVVHLGTGAWTLILVLIISGWIGIASVTRTQFYRYKGREYVLASRTLGAKDGRLIFRHILPNALGTIITSSVLMIPGVIFSESTISFLGYGIGHGQTFNLGFIELTGVSLGVLLADGQTMLVTYPHLTIFPAIVISILMISFNMFGNALRDAFNPSLRGVEE